MKLSLVLTLCAVLAMVGCRRRKLEPKASVESSNQPEAAQVSAPSVPAQTQPSSNQAAPPNIPTIEAGVEFGDLNNIIEGYLEFHKRMPTVEELKKSYYGGTKPLPIPPGYKLVIDHKGKKARLVPGN
jgi:hypothetical protein